MGDSCLPVHVCLWGNHGVFSPQIPSLPTGLFVSAKGEGCCLMQVRLQGEQTQWHLETRTPGGAGQGSKLSIGSGCVGWMRVHERPQGRLSASNMQPTLPKAGPKAGDHMFPWA